VTEIVPPNNLPAERSLLATVLANPECLSDVTEHVGYVDFYGRPEAMTFRLMLSLESEGQPIELAAILQAARADGCDGIVTSVWLAGLLDEPATLRAVETAREIRNRHRQREMIAALRKLAAEGSEHTINVDAWIGRCEQTVYDLAQQAEGTTPGTMAQVTARVLDTLNARVKGERDYIPTTLGGLNNIIQGWVRGKTHWIAARPGNGKTAFLLQEAIAIAERRFAVVIGSFEMSREELGERALSQCGQVDNKKLLRGELDQDDWNRIAVAVNRLNGLPIAILDKAQMSVAELASATRRQLTLLRRIHGNDLELGALIVDYVQLMHGPGEGEEMLSRIITDLRALAKSMNPALLGAVQMNRNSKGDGAQRASKRPQLTDLRGSGQFEADAHKVIFIHNENAHLSEDQQTPERTFIVAKNRGGGTGDTTMMFQGKFTRFITPAHESHDHLDNVHDNYMPIEDRFNEDYP
jgi:replicative DNA helicase